jgi:PAS domain-containing protein
VTGWIGVGIDITESKLIEQELRENELEARLAFSAGHMGSWRWNPRTNEGSWSPELEDLVGIERGSYDGTWDSFVRPILIEDGPHLRDVIGAAAAAGDEFTVGYRIRRPDGVVRWIETRGRELGDDGDWIGVSIDVTEQRRAEDALRDSNSRLGETVGRLDTLLANAPLGFAFYDRDLRYVRRRSGRRSSGCCAGCSRPGCRSPRWRSPGRRRPSRASNATGSPASTRSAAPTADRSRSAPSSSRSPIASTRSAPRA